MLHAEKKENANLLANHITLFPFRSFPFFLFSFYYQNPIHAEKDTGD
jgi:hypothetical protein